jgi:hypothetical protein
MPTTMLLNGLSATAVRLMIPYRGVWTADVDFDLELVPGAPAGPALLTIGTTILLGFVDPDGSGIFGAKGRARVIGGFGGWHKHLPAQHFTSDAGVLSTEVLTVTASLVGEKVVQILPSVLGAHYTRTDGAASRVLAGLDWYVDTLTGITTVGPRLPVPVRPDTVEVLEWDALEQRATIATDDVLVPGSVLVDIRFGTAQVRDVEQMFDENGARATAMCRASSLDLGGLLASFAKEAVRPEYQMHHTYRVVLQAGDSRLVLQAVKLLGAVPDMLPITMCMGAPGFDAKLAPGSEVLVAFADGDPSKPLVMGFAASSPPPLEVSNNALHFRFGLGTSPVGLSIGLQTQITALQTQITALGSALAVLGADPTHTAPSTGTALAAAASAVTAGASAVSAAVVAATSTRTFTD